MSLEEATETCYCPEYVIALQNREKKNIGKTNFSINLHENCFEDVKIISYSLKKF